MNQTQFIWLSTSILIIVLFYLWHKYNSFIRARNLVKTDFADIDVQLKRRAALIENLVTIVKEYAKHEKSTFEDVTKARSILTSSNGPKQTAQAENLLTTGLRTLLAVSESYPKLQASENYQQLSTELEQTENLIAGYRETYNQSVLRYNTKLQIFPDFLIAGLFGFKEEELYTPEITARDDVKIDFSK